MCIYVWAYCVNFLDMQSKVISKSNITTNYLYLGYNSNKWASNDNPGGLRHDMSWAPGMFFFFYFIYSTNNSLQWYYAYSDFTLPHLFRMESAWNTRTLHGLHMEWLGIFLAEFPAKYLILVWARTWTFLARNLHEIYMDCLAYPSSLNKL